MLKKISYMTAGESHGKGLIGIIEGIPAGMNITEGEIALKVSKNLMPIIFVILSACFYK